MLKWYENIFCSRLITSVNTERRNHMLGYQVYAIVSTIVVRKARAVFRFNFLIKFC